MRWLAELQGKDLALLWFRKGNHVQGKEGRRETYDGGLDERRAEDDGKQGDASTIPMMAMAGRISRRSCVVYRRGDAILSVEAVATIQGVPQGALLRARLL